MLSLSNIITGIPETTPLFKIGEVHTLVIQNSMWTSYLVEQFSVQQPALLVAPAVSLERTFKRMKGILKQEYLQFAEWKHTKHFNLKHAVAALDRMAKQTPVIFLHLNFNDIDSYSKDVLKSEFNRELSFWAASRGKLLFIIIEGDISEIKVQAYLTLNSRHLQSLHFIYQSQSYWRWNVQFWFSGYSLSRWQWDLSETTNQFGHSSFIVQNRQSDLSMATRLGEHAAKFICENALSSNDFTPSIWQRFDADFDLKSALQPGSDAVVILGLRSREHLFKIAEVLFHLRKFAGKYLRILVRALDESLRIQDERFLISCGATLILPAELSTRSLLNLAETTTGFIYTHTLPESFNDIQVKEVTLDVKGYLPPLDFCDAALEYEKRAKKFQIDSVLIEANLATGLNPIALIRRFSSRRFGDLLTFANNKMYLYLHACRESDANNVISMSFGLPVKSIFKHEIRNSNHSKVIDLIEELKLSSDISQAEDLTLELNQLATKSGNDAESKDSVVAARYVKKAEYL